MRDLIAPVALFMRDVLSIRISQNRISRAGGGSMSRGNVRAMMNSNMQAPAFRSATASRTFGEARVRRIISVLDAFVRRAHFPPKANSRLSASVVFLINGYAIRNGINSLETYALANF